MAHQTGPAGHCKHKRDTGVISFAWCKRKPVADGYCMQHHPAYISPRDAENYSLEELQRFAAAAGNACHDWCVANAHLAEPGKTLLAPAGLRAILRHVEKLVRARRRTLAAAAFETQDAGQRAWETAMGMRGYAGSPAEREDRAALAKAEGQP